MLAYAPDIEIVGEAENGAEALSMAGSAKPDIVLMDINMPVMNGIDATRRIVDELPGVSVVIVSVQDEFESLKLAMQAGAKEYLLKPFAAESMQTAIRGVYARGERQQRVTTTAILSDRLHTRSKAITLSGAKGGVGKTTLAVNLGAALARMGKSVAVVDMDLVFGDAALLLGMEAKQRNLYSLMLEGESFADALEGYLLRHSSGLSLLAAPESAEQGEYVTAPFMQNVIRALKRDFEYVLIDTPPALTELYFSVLELSDENWLCFAADLASAKNARRLLDILQTLGYGQERARPIWLRRGAVGERTLEEVLGMEIFSSVRFDPQTVCTANDLAEPFVLSRTHSKAARDVLRLAVRLVAEERRVLRESRTARVRRLLGGMR